MRRAWRWFGRIVIGLLLLAVLAVGVVLIVLHTSWGRALVKSKIVAALQTQFPGSTIGELTGSVLGEIVLHDVELVGLDHKPLASIETLEVEVSLLPLLGKTARVDRLVARSVTAYPRKLPPPIEDKGPTGWSVELPQVEVHEGTLIVETVGRPAITVDQIDVAGSAMIPAAGSIRAFAVLGGRWDNRRFGGVATATIGDEIEVPFATIGTGRAYVVAHSASVRARRGGLIAQLPAADLAALVPASPVQGDAFVVASAAHADANETRILLSASVGAAQLDAVALVDPEARTGRGVIGTSGVELGSVTGDRVRGHGRAVIAAITDRTHARATLIAGGRVQGEVAGDLVIAADGLVHLDGSQMGLEILDRSNVLLFATGSGGARVGAVGVVKRVDRTLVIESSQVGASVTDPVAASGGRAPVRGAIAVEASATGPVSALAVQGKVWGKQLRFERIAATRLTGTFGVTLDAKPAGTAHVAVDGLVNAGKRIGSVIADATTRADGRIDVRVRARAALFPLVADVSAVVTPGKITEVALVRHRFDTPAGTWIGNGGHVRIEPRTIVVRGFRTTQGDAWAKVDATVGRASSALAATVEAHALPTAAIDPKYRGTVSGALSLTRARGKWSGSGMFSATALAFAADKPAIDAGVTVGVDGRRVSVAVNASNEDLGGARIALEVDGPKDLIDKAAWLNVARGDLHAVTIGVDHVDAAVVSKGRTAGLLDGTLEIRDGVPSGTLFVRGVPTPAGTADADLTLELTDVGFVDVKAKANIGAVGAATAGARLAIPDHPFDPEAWKALGTHVVHSATAEAKDVVIDPKLLAALKVDAPVRGTASVKLELGAGATSATVTVDVRGITGGPLIRGIDVHVGATADDRGTTGVLRVSAGAATIASLPKAATPVTLDRWIADARSALSAPITGTLALGKLDAKEALAIVGRSDVTSGTIEGSIGIAGTIGTPTANGTLDLHDIRVAPRFSTKPPPALTALHVDASWGGVAGHVKITGDEAGKGTLLVDVRGRPDDVASLFGMVNIKKFDLAPVVVFLPGRFAGASGVLEADLTVKGTGTVRGTLGLVDGRVPIAPAIGTLRKANVTLSILDTGITARFDGKLGAGSVKLTATSGVDGVDTTVDATLSKVSPIGALQPILDSTLHGTFHRVGLKWTGKATVSKTSVKVPEQAGHALLDANAPADLILVDLPIPRIPLAAAAPTDPFLVVDVKLEPATITVREFAVDAVAKGKLQVAVGETVGLDGEITVERGSADLFGHRYRVELGQLVFDGTTDGLLNLKLAHDFSDVTTFVRFAGRLSELAGQEPEFSSDPGIYTQGQLLGFFLGGEPGGDPTKQTREAAVGFGAALASSTIGKRLKKYLPIDLLVARCDPGAGTSSGSCTFGTWVTSKVFLSYKHNLEARYDQNTEDGTVEWHWRPNWVLELSGGDRNFYGSDVLWRRRW